MVWDLGDGPDAPPPVRRNAQAALLQAHGSSVCWLGFSRQGTLASAAPDGSLRLYELGDTGGPGGGSGAGAGTGTGKAHRQPAAAVCDGAADECAFAWGCGGGAGRLFGLAPGQLQAWAVPVAPASAAMAAAVTPAAVAVAVATVGADEAGAEA